MARSGEAVARNVGDCGIQGRQRAHIGLLRQQPDHDREQTGRGATGLIVDVRRDETGMRRIDQGGIPRVNLMGLSHSGF
jgi:hypothetical protein